MLATCVTIHIIAIFKAPFVSLKTKIYTIFYLWYKINIRISHLPSHNISLSCYQTTWSKHNWIIWIYVWKENLNFIIVKQENLTCNFTPLFDVVKHFVQTMHMKNKWSLLIGHAKSKFILYSNYLTIILSHHLLCGFVKKKMEISI